MDWCSENYLELNVSKTKEMVFDLSRTPCNCDPVQINDENVELVTEYKYLGTVIDRQLNWSSNIRRIVSKTQQRLYFLRKLKDFDIDRTIMYFFYMSVIQSVFTFCLRVFIGNARKTDLARIQRITRTGTR